jgi:amino-acid N-acetyltransferase
MIRKAVVSDVKTICQLMGPFASRGVILPRSLSEVYDNLRDYYVYCHEGQATIVGACAIHVCWEDLAEIRSLAVKDEFAGRGIGKSLVKKCLAEARELGVRRVFVLTYQKDFFEKMGFRVVDKAELPHKVWADCVRCIKFPDCDEVAMLEEL